MRIVVPVLLHNQRLAVGAEAFEGIVGGTNYYWGLEKTIPSAKAFNDAFRAVNGGAIPTDYGAYAYMAVKSLLQAMTVAAAPILTKSSQLLKISNTTLARGRRAIGSAIISPSNRSSCLK